MGILIAILVFEFMILIHEWGHYIAARKNGVFVQEFALGMGPKIVAFYEYCRSLCAESDFDYF